MHTPFSLRRRSSYPWWFAATAATALIGFYLLPKSIQSSQLLLSAVGGIAAFFHFLYSQHSANTERFTKLFHDFNARYDGLNDRLNLIIRISDKGMIEQEDIQTLYDYFNLCGEEYLYFKSGFIDEEVWQSWIKGMNSFAANANIRRVWEREIEEGSYYGFSLALLQKAA